MTRHRRHIEAWQRGEQELAPVARLLGIVPVEIGAGRASVAMSAGAQHHNAFGVLHGGLLCALADVAMGLALATQLEDGEGLATLEQHMNHLRSVRGGQVVAEARVLRRGRGAAHVDCDVRDAQGQAIARASCVCSIVQQASDA